MFDLLHARIEPLPPALKRNEGERQTARTLEIWPEYRDNAEDGEWEIRVQSSDAVVKVEGPVNTASQISAPWEGGERTGERTQEESSL